MEFREYFQLPEPVQGSVLAQIRDADWTGVRFLYDLLIRGALSDYSGKHPRLLLLMDADQLVSLCTLSCRDEIHNTSLTPWIGFVYTVPAFRGHRFSQRLIEYGCSLAKAEGHAQIYVSSDEYGLYEKYGFHFLGYMCNVRNEQTPVFVPSL